MSSSPNSTAGPAEALPTPSPLPPSSAFGDSSDQLHQRQLLNQQLQGSGGSSSSGGGAGGGGGGRMPSLSFLYGSGASGKMMSSSTDDSDDVQDALVEELGNIRSVMHVTRENIDALNDKFSQLTEPPPMYVQEYEELTSKLHELKLKEQELEERLLEQQEHPQQQHHQQMMDDLGDGSEMTEELRRELESTIEQYVPSAKSAMASAAEHFTKFATSMDKNMSTDEASVVV